MVKRKKQILEKEYRKPLLFIDEVEVLYSIFLECSDHVKISAGGFEYEDFEDFMANHQGDSVSFCIEGGYTDIKLRLWRYKGVYSAKLEGWDAPSERLAAFHRADSVMARVNRETWFDKLYWSSCIATGFFSYLMLDLLAGETLSTLSSLFVMGYFIGVGVWIWRLFQKQKMVFRRRRDTLSFIERNKDQIVVGLLIAVLSSGFTLLTTKLFDSWQLGASTESIISKNVEGRQYADEKKKGAKVVSKDESKN